MKKQNTDSIMNRVFSFMSAVIIGLNSMPMMTFTTANAASNASSSGSVMFPINDSDRSAKLNHDDTLVDNGDGTFTYTSKISASYSYSDTSKSRLQTTDDYYEFKKKGKYLIELWGGDGGDGGRAFLSGRNGLGGKGGFVYGILNVDDTMLNKRLYYEIGSKGESKTYDVSGGGNAGDGGGAGNIALVSIGAGGGYSAVYLLDKDETISADPETAPTSPDPVNNNKDNTAKVLMIAGGGGGGAAGANGFHLTALILKMHGDGGDGGSVDSSIIATPNIGNFTSGTYYAGEDGTSSGRKTSYVGQGGTDKPEGLAKTTIGFMTASTHANDWQRTYHQELRRGVGGAGNLHGGGGGAGFAGGGGGIQNIILDANNVGGGGGGSSYLAENTAANHFYPLNTLSGYNNIESSDYFVDKGDNTNAETGGAIVIRYLEDSHYYDYLNDVTISGEVSEYFDIVSANTKCENNINGTVNVLDSTADSEGRYFTVSGNNISFRGSLEPQGKGLTMGQPKNTLTLTLRLKPKATFAGGNNVPIFVEDANSIAFTCASNEATPKTCAFLDVTDSKEKDVSHVNVKYNIPFEANNTLEKKSGDTYTDADLFTSKTDYATVSSNSNYAFISGISYQVGINNTGTISYNAFVADNVNTVTAADVTAKKKVHSLKAVVTSKYDPAVVGSAGDALIKKATVKCYDEGALSVDGFDVKAKKSLVYNTTDETYDFTVGFDIESKEDVSKTFSINQAIPSVKVLDLALGQTNVIQTLDEGYVGNFTGNSNTYSGTLEPGIYYVEAWGGDGGSGQNAIEVTSSNRTRSFTHGGYGGKGGYISGYVVLDEEKNINITLGYRGANSSSDTAGGEGGEATFVWIDQTNRTNDNASLIAGGGGGGSNYLDYGLTDGHDHMGYCGNDGYRKGGISAYRGIPSDYNYGNDRDENLDVYYKTNEYKGDNGLTVTVGGSGLNYHSRINETFDGTNVSKYFAKGGYSKIGTDVSEQLPSMISNKLFINIGSANISLSTLAANVVNPSLGLYDYVNGYYNNLLGNQYYISQWADSSSFNGSGDNFERISRYVGTTKTGQQIKDQKAGAVRITRLGVYGGHNYGSTTVNNLTDTSGTLTALETQITTDYTADYNRAFTVSSDFSEYFDLLDGGTEYNRDSSTGKYIGTHTYNFTNANVEQLSFERVEDQDTFSGYNLLTDTYMYGLKGTDTVTFKLKPKGNLVGGNDIPLLDVKTLAEIGDTAANTAYMSADKTSADPPEVSISHSNTTVADDDIDYIARNDTTDWANVTIKEDAFSLTALPSEVVVDYGQSAAINAGIEYGSGKNHNFVTESVSVAPSELTKDGTYTVVGTVESAEAQKAVVIPSVEPKHKSGQVDVRIKYTVNKSLDDLHQVSVEYLDEGETTAMTIGGNVSLASDKDSFTVNDIHDAYVITIEPDTNYDLPADTGVTVTYDGAEAVMAADVTKKDGKIIITIPSSAFTNNITISARGIENRTPHYVHFLYSVYDEIGGFQTYEEVLTENGVKKPFYSGAEIDGITFPFAPSEYPDGYDDYLWEWSVEASNGHYYMGDKDVYIMGNYVPTTYTLIINYVAADQTDTGFVAPPQYTSPRQSTYNEATGASDIAITKGAEFSIKSPEVDGYTPSQLYYSGTADDTFLGQFNNNKEFTVTITYTKDPSPSPLKIYRIICDDYGITVPGDEGTPVSEADATWNSYDRFKITKWDVVDTKTGKKGEVEVDSISDSGTYYAYYKPHHEQIPINFNKVDPYVSATDRPDPDRVTLPNNRMTYVYEGLEFCYFDTQNDKYVNLPDPVCSDQWLFDGWYTAGGQLITDDTTVKSEYVDQSTGKIELYAHWIKDEFTISVDYRYALNATPYPGNLIDENDITSVPKEKQHSVTLRYNMGYSFTSPTVDGYALVNDEEAVIKGNASKDEHFDVYYLNENSDPTQTFILTVNVYSETYRNGSTDNPVSGARKLQGGTFALYQNGTKVDGSERYNENGTIVWSNIETDIASGVDYTVKCIDPPTGYGTASVKISSNEDEKNIFLDKNPFQLPMAGSKPLTGYTVCGLSTMLLAAFLMFIYVSSKAEENENE